MEGSSHPISLSTHFAALVLLYLLALPSTSVAVNVTALLAGFPELSAFSRLMTATSVAADVAARSSVTVLAVPDAILLRSGWMDRPAADLADVLRYHVLLRYISLTDLRAIPPAGELVATLYQTTGRAAADTGAVNLTRSSASGRVSAHSSSSNATVVSLVESVPYDVSVFAVDALLVPSGYGLAASERGPGPGPAPGLSITRVLVDGGDFNVAAAMLAASGVAQEFEADERGAGITVFAPTDEAFAALPVTARLQALPADRKAAVLRFHVLHSYYPLGSLESIVNPVQPTIATEDSGAGRFTLNITRVNGSVAIGTGLVQASITRTVFDQNPVAVFAVSRVLLPREIFGKEAALAEAAPPDGGAMPPEYPPATRLSSSPPGLREEVSVAAAPPPASGAFSCTVFAALLLLLVWDIGLIRRLFL